jgi:S-DNA-T family DNA segregation ATPase FtsK/SpoIIIE
MTSCAECGWEYGSLDLRAHAMVFVDAFDGSATRPAPEVWSPLEYACHVRDVLRINLGRVARGLVEETPRFEPMNRDQRPAMYRYAEQDPDVVAREVLDAAEALALVFDAMTDEQLDRTVTYNWPTEMVRSLRWVGQHTVHELVHHRMDVQRVDGAPSSASPQN